MAIYEFDFIFCCPSSVSDIFESRFFAFKKKFEFACFVHRRHPKKTFDVYNFRIDKSMFICCFDHLTNALYFDFVDCLHYQGSSNIF